jgi:hypothetical protein
MIATTESAANEPKLHARGHHWERETHPLLPLLRAKAVPSQPLIHCNYDIDRQSGTHHQSLVITGNYRLESFCAKSFQRLICTTRFNHNDCEKI